MHIVHPLLCGCIFYTVLIDKNSWKIYNYSIAYKNKRKGENLLEKFLNKMERKFGRYAIPGLMKYICVLYIIGLFINIASPQVYYYYLSLNPYRILHGEVWRLVTFLIQSPNSNVIFFIFDPEKVPNPSKIHSFPKTASSNPESMKQQPFTVEPSPICMYPPAPAPQKAESQR